MHPVGAGEPRELDLSPQPEADVAAALGQLVVLAARIANQARGGDQVDGWIRDGTLGGAQKNAADFQIATSIRLLLCFDELRPLIDGRPAASLAERLVPSFPGHVPRVIPPAWLPLS